MNVLTNALDNLSVAPLEEVSPSIDPTDGVFPLELHITL